MQAKGMQHPTLSKIDNVGQTRYGGGEPLESQL